MPTDFVKSVDNDLKAYVDSIETDADSAVDSFDMGESSDRLNNDIKALTGIDTSSYRHRIRKNTIKHIFKRHGKKGQHDRSMANNDDIARIGYVLNNYDNIELLADVSNEYRDKNQRPAPLIKLSKKVDGTVYVAEAVPDTRAKKLAVVSAYIEKPSQQTRDVQAPLSDVQNASADDGSIDKLPQIDGTVKTEGELPIAEMQNVETEATNKRHVAQFAEKMERAGATVLTEMYGAETDPIGYIRDMMKIYSAGRKGADISTVEGVESINPAQVKAMYAAGVADSGRSSGAIDNAGQIAYTESNVDSGFSGVNNEVYFTAPDSNMPVAVGNLATQNNIVSAVQNFPDLTVSELATEFAPTSKEYRVLQAYIDAGYGNEIAAEVLNYNTQTNSEAMTENERKALVEYKSSESYKINAKLRGGVKLNSQETEFVNHVDSALEKLPVHRGAVYRNVVFDDFGGKEQFDAFMEVHQADGVPIIYYSYTSTSTVDDGYPVNGEYVAHMIINGQNGRNMDGIGNNFEKEVLFPRKSAFIVDKIEYGADGYPTIYMTEVTNEGQGYEGNIRRDNRGEQRTPADGQENTMWQVHQVHSKNDEMPGISKRNTDADNDTRRNVRQVSGEITEGNIYGEEVHLRRGSEWIDGTNTGRPIQGLEESSRRNPSREATSRPADSGAASLTYGEKVSTASLGIGGGTNAKTIRLVKGGNTAAIAEARAIAKQRGLRLVLFAGDNLDIRRDGERISARAYISGDRVFVRVDHPTFTAAQLIKHEAGHDMIRKGEIDPNKTRARLEKTYGKDKLDYVSNLYAEAYASNGYNMTAEEIWEEVICDSLADMNVFDKTRNEVSAKEALGAIKADVAENKTPATRGPPIGVGAEGKASRDTKKYWYPKLTKKEWRLLERRMNQEIGYSSKYLDKETKWLFDTEKGVTIFAVYGIGDGTVPTPLYASGGAKAQRDIVIFNDIVKEYENGIDRSAEELNRWLETKWSGKRYKRGDSYAIRNRGAADGDAGVHSRPSRGDRQSVDRESNADSQINDNASRELDIDYVQGDKLNNTNKEGAVNDEFGQNDNSRKLGRFRNQSETERLGEMGSVGQVQSKKSNTPHTKNVHRSGVSAETLTSSGLTAEQATLRKENHLEGFRTEFYTIAKKEGVRKKRTFRTEDTIYYPDSAFERNEIVIKNGVATDGAFSRELYTDEVMFSSRYKSIDQATRKLYDSAKRGDNESAYELISHLLNEDVEYKIKSLGNDAYLLPVIGVEETSTNVLPSIIADYISKDTGQAVFKGIGKNHSSNSRSKSVWDRMKENYPSFVFDERYNIKPSSIEGKKFVLIDDNSTTGRTFVGLKNLLEEYGGEVVGYYALTTGQDQSEKMITTNETWNELLRLGLNKVKEYAQKEGVKREISKLGLSERESQELIKQFRREIAISGRGIENDTRSGSGGRELQAIQNTERDGRTDKSKKQKGIIRSQQKYSLELDTDKFTDEENDFLEIVQSGIRDTVREELDRMGQEYGWIPKGENPAREVNIPKKTAKDKYVSQTVRTILEAKATPEEMLPSIEELVADGEFSYDRYTDKTAIADAENTIRNKGWVKTLANWLSDSKKGKISKEHTALGWALYNNAVNKGDVETAIDVLDHIVGNQRNAAQALQATRILKKLSPETQLYQAQRSVESLQNEINARHRKDGDTELKINEDLARQFMEAETQEARDTCLLYVFSMVYSS